MAEAKTKKRADETREKESRRKPWAPPQHLEAPEPPEGFVHRWIRVSLHGKEDQTNAVAKLREGWEPVRADEYPDFEAPKVAEGKYAGVIGNGGLILCRIPAETVQERNAYYGTRTRDQMQSVDQNLMREQHPDAEITINRRSQVSFGGRKDTE